MPVPSIITSAKAAAKAYRLRVSIESIVQGIEASRLRPGDGSGDALASEDSGIVERIFRNESFVTDTDRRYDTASRYERIVLGDDRIALDELRTHIRGKVTQQFGERSRSVRRFKRTTDNQETFLVGNRYEETVHGRVTLTAEYSAEAIVGGAYINTITHAYLRIAGWIDCMAWGGWVRGGRHPVRDRAADDPFVRRLCPRHGRPADPGKPHGRRLREQVRDVRCPGRQRGQQDRAGWPGVGHRERGMTLTRGLFHE